MFVLFAGAGAIGAGAGDYVTAVVDLSFGPTSLEDCTDISIINDVVFEQDEVFTVQLSTDDEQIMLSPRSASVTIQDNDGKNYTLLTICLVSNHVTCLLKRHAIFFSTNTSEFKRI